MLFEVSFTAPIYRDGDTLTMYWFDNLSVNAKNEEEAQKKAIKNLKKHGWGFSTTDVSDEFDLDDYDDTGGSYKFDFPEVDQVLKV